MHSLWEGKKSVIHGNINLSIIVFFFFFSVLCSLYTNICKLVFLYLLTKNGGMYTYIACIWMRSRSTCDFQSILCWNFVPLSFYSCKVSIVRTTIPSSTKHLPISFYWKHRMFIASCFHSFVFLCRQLELPPIFAFISSSISVCSFTCLPFYSFVFLFVHPFKRSSFHASVFSGFCYRIYSLYLTCSTVN